MYTSILKATAFLGAGLATAKLVTRADESQSTSSAIYEIVTQISDGKYSQRLLSLISRASSDVSAGQVQVPTAPCPTTQAISATNTIIVATTLSETSFITVSAASYTPLVPPPPAYSTSLIVTPSFSTLVVPATVSSNATAQYSPSLLPYPLAPSLSAATATLAPVASGNFSGPANSTVPTAGAHTASRNQSNIQPTASVYSTTSKEFGVTTPTSTAEATLATAANGADVIPAQLGLAGAVLIGFLALFT